MDIGEFEIISRIKSQVAVPEEVTGIGDDCAILPQFQFLDSDTLVSTDMLIEGTHFLLDKISPYSLGLKSANVNLSDIAAMGGRPIACFLSLGLTEKVNSKWVDEFIKGFKFATIGPLLHMNPSLSWSCPLLGGDTTKSPSGVCINVTVIGTCISGRAIKRSGAKEGDLICVTNCLGDSAAGLRCILDGEDNEDLIMAHNHPKARVSLGLKLARTEGIHSMMDISDGIGSDLRHILKASNKSAIINCSAIPLSEELKKYCSSHNFDPLDFALNGGEDYELLFTMSPDTKPDIPYYVIGQIVSGSENTITWEGTDKDFTGFNHF